MNRDHNETPAKEQHPSPSRLIVRGVVRDGDGDPASEARVRLVARRLCDETTVGEAVTDGCGAYEARVTANVLEGAALVVRAERGQEQTSSEPIFAPAPELRVDLVLGGGRWEGPTELETITAAVTPELCGLAPADLGKEQVVFLAGRTRIPAERLQLWVWAHRRGRETEIAPEALYALARGGLPTALPALAAQPSPVIRTMLARAVTQRLVPLRALRTAERTEGRLRALHADEVSRPGAPLRVSLTAAGLPAAIERRWLDLHVSHGGAAPALRAAALADPELAAHIPRIELGVQVATLARGHAPLAEAIAGLGAGSLRELARRPVEEWRELVTRAGVPPDTDGATPEAQRAHFLETIRRTFEVLCPTAALAARLVQDDQLATPDVRRFLERFPDYELRDSHVDAFVAAHPGALEGLDDADACVRRLKLLQRLIRLSPRHEDIARLFAAGIDSAQRLVALGRAAFLAAHAQALGPARAADIYERARQIAAAAALLHAQEIAASSPATFLATRRPAPEEA